MESLEGTLARLRNLTASIRTQDKELVEAVMDNRPRNLEILRETVRERAGPELESALEGAGPEAALRQEIVQESIALRDERPVLDIIGGTIRLEFRDQRDIPIWKDRLTAAKGILDIAIPAVGRIELVNAGLAWVGTGWLIAETVIVTNRHVAVAFARRKGDGFAFRTGPQGKVAASVDFLEEIDRDEELRFDLLHPLHIEEEGGPDIAFFEVAQTSGGTALSGKISFGRPTVSKQVAVIGYPASDSRIPDAALMTQLYGNVYDKKRLAPGAITQVGPALLKHNCTTLGGNSGSCVIDLDSGKAVGLHFSGRFLDTNYAVPGDLVGRVLESVRSGRVPRRSGSRDSRTSGPSEQARASARASANGLTLSPAGLPSQTITIPLTLTIGFGQVTVGGGAKPMPMPLAPAPADRADEIDGEEGPAESYADRGGYNPRFLVTAFDGEDEDDAEVPFPVVGGSAGSDVLGFSWQGKEETELRYTHFSVVMSRSRRMCIFSAANIDGRQSKRTRRVGWKWDPRIPRAQQIMNECYGNPPKFSRGHMTRREDPAWGEAPEADRGNADSMHVTNATPQMQAFNSPIWLELEDYALDHAREDDMRVSVFTGPYFGTDDPERHGVRIPVSFWKIIAFIHDETKRLCATGYEMNQEGSLPSEEEFVFGSFQSSHLNTAAQVPIAAIQRKTGIDFGPLAGADPLGGGEESLRGEPGPLMNLDQIRFL